MKIIVIGAGHAGIEAAYAAARMGAETILLTIHLETLAQMSCNPSIGGIAKGHLVKEIDALGGVMPRAADVTGLHFKVLNRSKGPAVRATRTQNDKIAYRNYLKSFLETVPNLKIYQAIANEIAVANGRVCGVRLMEGETLAADAVIVSAGTFLAGRIFIGAASYAAGRANEPPAQFLAENIAALGFKILRLKTGTPMRLHADTIDWQKFIPQRGDDPPLPFSMFTKGKVKNRVLCHLGYTNPEVAAIIRDNLHLSPLYSGKIQGIGPRYCPSIEDKIVKFADKERHHFYLEPEGLCNKEIYVNGMSSSLPVEVQKKILRAIPGLDKAQMMRPAYAIEYDAIQPTQLRANLEAREIENLFFAGQVNGTSGYEEAAAQGLMAGINAVLKVRGEAPFVLNRDEAYIGVMVDDIVHNGVDEPYRLFTARAEYRLQLREDNVFERLGGHALRLGLISQAVYNRETSKLERRQRMIVKLTKIKGRWEGKTEKFFKLLKMPEMTFEKLEELHQKPLLKKKTLTDVSYIEACVKYEGYIEIQKREVARMQKLQKVVIPADLDFAAIDGLSTEVKQKLVRSRPGTLGEAARVPGVTPASLNAISIYLTLKYKH
jgi:tRNA uridine 5-carboxymethylaminomethyl modification enzyme